jgi:hypothetical protein
MGFISEPGSYTLGGELCPNPDLGLADFTPEGAQSGLLNCVRSHPSLRRVSIDLAGSGEALFQIGVNWYILGSPGSGDIVNVFDADDNYALFTATDDLDGTPTVRVELSEDGDGNLTGLSIKKVTTL